MSLRCGAALYSVLLQVTLCSVFLCGYTTSLHYSKVQCCSCCDAIRHYDLHYRIPIGYQHAPCHQSQVGGVVSGGPLWTVPELAARPHNTALPVKGAGIQPPNQTFNFSFHKKLPWWLVVILDDIIKKGCFGKVAGWTYTVEFQKQP